MFGLHTRKNTLILLFLEIIVLLTAWGLFIQSPLYGYLIGWDGRISIMGFTSLYMVLLFLGLIAFGSYEPQVHGNRKLYMPRLLVVCAIMGAGTVCVLGITGQLQVFLIFRGILFTLLTFSVLYAVRLVYGLWGGSDLLKRRVLVIGDNKNATGTFRFCQNHPFLFKSFHMSVEECRNLTASLHSYCVSYDIDEIVVAHDGKTDEVPVSSLLECRTGGIELIQAGTFLERETGQVDLEAGYPTWFLFGDGFRHVGATLFLKRLLDVAMSSLVLAVGAIPMICTALAVWLGDRGPVFYTQVRCGAGGKPFKIYKFRSMRIDAEKNGAQWAKTNDDRITPIGHFIRKTRLDELPQIFNVFKGDMSFVGPRPERPEFVTELGKQIPHFEDRHSLKPGITGWAQINYPYGSSVDDAREKLKYDLYYIKNVSFILDLVIILKTVRVVLWREGR